MPRPFRFGTLRTWITALAITLLTGLDIVPARAGTGHAAPARHAGRGWQIFLSQARMTEPTGLAIDLRGAKHAAQWGYVADAGSGRIVKFGTGGRVLGSWKYGIPGHPAVLTVGGSGNLFVADKVSGSISKFSPNGQRLAFWTPQSMMPTANPPYASPRGISVDAAGKIYVAEYAAHSIIQLSPGGTLLQAWDTSRGFIAQYSVPHQNVGPLGNPTGVVYEPNGHVFVSTVCVPEPPCSAAHYVPVPNYGHDVLLVLSTSGAFSGYVGNFWFGLGYDASGVPIETPGKESESFVHIDAMAGDNRGHTFLAGTMWPRGGQSSLAVLSYSDLGYHTAPWRLTSTVPIAGVAVDGSGSAYVSQGSTLLKRSP